MPRSARPNLRVNTNLVNPSCTTTTTAPRSTTPSNTAPRNTVPRNTATRKPRPSRLRRFLQAISPTSATSPSHPLLQRPETAFGADMEQFVLAICTRPEQQLYDAPNIYEDDQTCTTREQALYDISRRKLTRASAMPPPPPLFQSATGLGNYTVITAGNSFSGSTRTRKWN